MLISGYILDNYFSPLDFITHKIVLDVNVLRPIMEHRVLWELHTSLVITIYHGRIQHLIKQSKNQLIEPHCFRTIITSYNILCFCSVECNKILFLASPWYRGKAQTKTYPRSTSFVIYTPYPIWIDKSMQLYIITQTSHENISMHALQFFNSHV